MYDTLPKNERKFTVNITGENTGTQYAGDFTVKCSLSIMEKQSLELEKTRLLADYANPTSGLMGIAVALSTLRTKIIKSPDWWKDSVAGAQLQDENILGLLMDETARMEREWREEIKKRAEEARKDSGNA